MKPWSMQFLSASSCSLWVLLLELRYTMIFWCYPVLLVHTLFYRSVSTAVGLSPYLVLLTVVEPYGVVAYDNFIAWFVKVIHTEGCLACCCVMTSMFTILIWVVGRGSFCNFWEIIIEWPNKNPSTVIYEIWLIYLIPCFIRTFYN